MIKAKQGQIDLTAQTTLHFLLLRNIDDVVLYCTVPSAEAFVNIFYNLLQLQHICNTPSYDRSNSMEFDSIG